MRLVAVIDEKGGVGKTTTAMSLAAICSEASRTLVVDVDPQRSASWWAERAGDRLPFDFTTETNINLLSKVRRIASQNYDVVIVDTPGNITTKGILSTVLENSDYVIVPTEASPLAVEPLIRTVRTVIGPTGIPYRVLINKVDRRLKGMLDDAFTMLDTQGIPRFEASTRQLIAHAQAPAHGLVVTQYPRDRYAIEAAGEYRAVALEMFADWNMAVGKHTPLSVAARTEGASA